MGEVSKENSYDKLPTIHSNNSRQKNLQMLLYQLKVIIVMILEISKENSNDKLPTIRSNNSRQKNLQMLFYQLKVPIVMILEIPVGTQIPKILRRFWCYGAAWLSISKDWTLLREQTTTETSM